MGLSGSGDPIAFIHESLAFTANDAEEEALLTSARGGDSNARAIVLKRNLALAGLLGLRYGPPWLRRVDAVQEAIVVLDEAIDDPRCPGDLGLVLPERIKARLQQFPDASNNASD